MSCAKCEEVQESGDIAYVRIGKANVGLIGCDEHVGEALSRINGSPHEGRPIFRVLNEPKE